MRREDIANFLNAERRISPLTAFSLLIVAGFIAGSLQLVAPRDTQSVVASAPQPRPSYSMAAAVYTSEYDDKANKTEYDSPAPESCTEAIKAALGKEKGPSVTATDKGQNATMDACFGGMVKQGKQPSQKPEDYDCVGRKGEVKITKDSAISTTEPSREAQKGKCMITKVCQTFPALDGQPQKEQCSTPKKEYGAGQTSNSQNAGLPPMPQIPSGGGGGGGGGGGPEAPQPNAPQPQTQPHVQPPTTQCSGVDPCGEDKPFELPKDEQSQETPPVTVCSGVDPCPPEGNKPGEGAKLNEFGQPVSSNGDLLTPPKPDSSMLDPNLDPGTSNAGTPRLQTSTFEPVKGGLGTITDEKNNAFNHDPSAKTALEPAVRAQTFDGKWAESAGQLPSVKNDEALSKSKLAQDLGINDIGKSWTNASSDAQCAGTPECYMGRTQTNGGAAPGTTAPPGQQPPAQQPPAQRPPGQQPPPGPQTTTIPDPQTGPRTSTG